MNEDNSKKPLLHLRCDANLREKIDDIIHLTKKKTGEKVSQQSLLHTWTEESADKELKRLKALPNKK